jgi:hypothetical protein
MLIYRYFLPKSNTLNFTFYRVKKKTWGERSKNYSFFFKATGKILKMHR